MLGGLRAFAGAKPAITLTTTKKRVNQLSLSVATITNWTLANSCITGVLIGRPSSVVTRVLTEKRQRPVTNYVLRFTYYVSRKFFTQVAVGAPVPV